MSQVRVAALADLPIDSGFVVDVAGVAVALFKDDKGVHALADRCSHAEASLGEGELFDGEVECPRHGAIFDIGSGAALTLPATKPVDTYDAEVRDGDVYVSSTPNEDIG